MKEFLTALCCLFLATTFAQTDQNFLRHPSLSPDGTRMAFSYQGDIWTANANGGEARRLTIHESYESDPQWSPDGQTILFSGERYGNGDLYTIPAKGGQVTRLTHFSGGDGSGRWIDNQHAVFSSSRMFRSVERLGEFYQVDTEGTTPMRMTDFLGNAPVVSPDGQFLAFERGNCRVAREAYRGPANRNIWIYDRDKETFFQVTKDEGQDVMPAWDSNNNLYFLSARDGRYNLYRVAVSNGQAQGDFQQLTDFSDMGIRHYSVALTGGRIAVEKGIDIYLMDADMGATPEEVEFDVTSDYRFYPVEKETFTSNLGEYEVSPNGKMVAFGIRGELFLMPEDKDKSRAIPLTDHSWRDQEVTWLNDSTVLFISDRNGNRDIYLLQSTDESEPDLYKTFKRSVTRLTSTSDHESDIILSPDRTQIVFMRGLGYGGGQLVVADINEAGITNERIMQDGWASPSGVSWSPDGQWLAYAMENLDFNEEIYIHKADDSMEPVNISLHPRGDYSPVWSADGRKLAFVSGRNFGDSDIWFAWLRKADWEKTQREWEEDEEPSGKKTESVDVQIDFDNIHRRLVQVTSLPGSESSPMISKDGETFYFSAYGGGRTTPSGEPAFMKVKWDGSERATVLSRRIYGLSWDKDHKQMYYVSNGRLAKLNPDSKKSENIPHQARMTINHEEEREQIFADAWQALNAGFYDPNFHGQSWTGLRDTYRPMAMAASTSQDFRTIFNEMLGQVNASHMGMYGPDPEETQRDRTGMLGIEVEPVLDGVLVTRVIPNSPADRTDSKLREGEIIRAVNGQPLGEGVNFYAQFEGMINDRVLLEVENNIENREVIIRPSGSVRGELYEEWVEQRRELTEKYSNGRLGYIHIQGMNWPSFERFERELTASGLGKEGIVIDVRYNGGGWTTDMLMTVLNVRQHSYTIPRGAAQDLDKEHTKFKEHYPFGERLPLSSWTKPSVALCNETSYSNAEIFSHAYKQLGHGTLVGVPTFGAVISTGSYGMMEGSRVRMPYRAWYVKATERNMEHGPAVPDVIVNYPPDAKGSGEDPQLKKAVEVLLGQINESDIGAQVDDDRQK
jgi:tricorn protease